MKKTLVACIVLPRAACAYAWEPAVDLAKVEDKAKYETDVAECKQLGLDASGGGIGIYSYGQVVTECLKGRGYKVLNPYAGGGSYYPGTTFCTSGRYSSTCTSY